MVNTPQINGWPSYTAARRDGPQNQQPYRGYRMRNASLALLTARATTLGALDEAKKSARASKSGAYIEIIGGKMDMPPALAYAMADSRPCKAIHRPRPKPQMARATGLSPSVSKRQASGQASAELRRERMGCRCFDQSVAHFAHYQVKADAEAHNSVCLAVDHGHARARLRACGVARRAIPTNSRSRLPPFGICCCSCDGGHSATEPS
jgi:hypothetical protein